MRGVTFNAYPRFIPPKDAPEGIIYLRVACPEGEEWEALFRGALLALTDELSFATRAEAQSPEDCAYHFWDAWTRSEPWSECSGGGVGGMEVGSVFLFAGGGDIPARCLECDGSQVSQAEYPELYAAIGDLYGEADPGYFRLPDLRGRVSLGAGEGAGLTPRALADTGGEEQHQLTVPEMPQHFHTISHSHTTANLATGTTALRRPSLQTEDTSMVGGNQPHENMPPFIVLRYVIVAEVE